MQKDTNVQPPVPAAGELAAQALRPCAVVMEAAVGPMTCEVCQRSTIETCCRPCGHWCFCRACALRELHSTAPRDCPRCGGQLESLETLPPQWVEGVKKTPPSFRLALPTNSVAF